MTADAMPAIVWDFERIHPDVVSHAAAFQAAIFADVAGRRGALHGRIRALAPAMRIAGSALTVEVRPGDNLMIHAALAIAKPGDVLVVDGKADQTCALMGNIMISACRKLGLAGVVLDAAVRDASEIESMGFPVFSVGTSPNGPTKCVPGRINHPVAVGGVVVHPGDFIIADRDGVVAVERQSLERLLPLARKKVIDEEKRIAAIEAGRVDAPWLRDALKAAGIEGLPA